MRDPPGCVVGPRSLTKVNLDVALWTAPNDPGAIAVSRASENNSLVMCMSVVSAEEILEEASSLSGPMLGCFAFNQQVVQ